MKSFYMRYGKRAFDLFAGLFLVTVFILLFAPIAVAIKLDSPGPIIFRQLRVTKDGQLFQMYKFRSMRITEEIPEVKTDLPREYITIVGAFLRKHRLDELPQALNVISGDMSIVGPRATSLGYFVANKNIHSKFHETLKVKAGLTSLAKVSISEKDRRTRVHCSTDIDLEYIDRVSFLLDIKVCVMTLWVVASGFGGE